MLVFRALHLLVFYHVKAHMHSSPHDQRTVPVNLIDLDVKRWTLDEFGQHANPLLQRPIIVQLSPDAPANERNEQPATKVDQSISDNVSESEVDVNGDECPPLWPEDGDPFLCEDCGGTNDEAKGCLGVRFSNRLIIE